MFVVERRGSRSIVGNIYKGRLGGVVKLLVRAYR